VIDVGANVGQFSIAAKKVLGAVAVHAFEPVPTSYEQLVRNVGRLQGVTTHQVALGDRQGESTMFVNKLSHASSLLPLGTEHARAFPQAYEVGEVQVAVSTLDEVFLGEVLKGPLMLKLDVQGYEAKTLGGGAALLRDVDHVVVESSFRPLYEGEASFRDMVGLLEEHGFEFDHPLDWLLSADRSEIVQMDALFRRVRAARFG
jgi:FkbM family methyltransferase